MPSRTMSRHHWYMVSKSRVRPRVISSNELKWNQIANPDVRRKAATAPVRGHGLGSTMWYACA